jgi:hypothetical protein
MSTGRQQHSVVSNLVNTWKVRPINGFEKYLFPNTQTSTSASVKYSRIDPARFIYPRDAMGNMLDQKTIIPRQFHLPKYDFVKPRSPAWTIKNIYPSKGVIHSVGSMT